MPDDFATSYVPRAYNLPLRSLSTSTPSSFSDASILKGQWKKLDATFTTDRINAHGLVSKDAYITCYGGETARIAMSVLRTRDIVASSVKGGYPTLRRDSALADECAG